MPGGGGGEGTPRKIAKRTITKNRMQMIISPTGLTQHQRLLGELEGI